MHYSQPELQVLGFVFRPNHPDGRDLWEYPSDDIGQSELLDEYSAHWPAVRHSAPLGCSGISVAVLTDDSIILFGRGSMERVEFQSPRRIRSLAATFDFFAIGTDQCTDYSKQPTYTAVSRTIYIPLKEADLARLYMCLTETATWSRIWTALPQLLGS